MPIGTTRLALTRLLKRRARQRSAAVARARDVLVGGFTAPAARRIVVPAALRICNEAAVRRLLMAAERRGFATYDEVDEILPTGELSCDQIEAIVDALHSLGVAYET
jgi:Sigma-70 factor, region 1.1